MTRHDRGSPRRPVAWLLMLLLAPTLALAAPDLSPATPTERAAVVEALGGLLAAEYVDPAMAATMKRTLADNLAAGNYVGLDAGQAFADRLTADLREVGHDKHLWIGYRPEGAVTAPLEGPSPGELDRWRAQVAADNFAFDRVERMPGNIGYVKFRIFAYPYLAAETATAAMTFVAHTDAVIVDLRENGGGDPDMVAFLASYFFDRPVQLNDIRSRRDNAVRQYWTLPQVPGQRFGGRKPVFILTSASTFSAAEDFAYALQSRGRAVVVGETTGGGARPSREIRVAQRFVASIPYAESLSPVTGANWERKGVLPDRAVAASDALEVAYRAALDTLIGSTDDPGRQAGWRALQQQGAPRP